MDNNNVILTKTLAFGLPSGKVRSLELTHGLKKTFVNHMDKPKTRGQYMEFHFIISTSINFQLKKKDLL